MSSLSTRLRILVLRDPGFQLDGQDTESGDLTAVLEEDQSFKVTESAAGYGEAARAAHRGDVDVIVIDEVAGDPAAVVEQLDQAAPEIPVIVVLEPDLVSVAQACILAGARAYVFRPFDPGEMADLIKRIYEKEDRRRRKSLPSSGPKSGRLIAVHGPKGGVGTTTIAVNLAVALYQQTNLRIVLVDGSLLSGDVAVAMNIANENSIADVVAHLRELDGDLLNDTLLHHGSGLWVLPAPSELERAEVINGEETTAVLAALRQYYDVIVVDTASRPDEHLLAALDQSDVVLVVCTPEIASLKNAARFLALAHELGYGDEKLKLTINRLSSHGSIPLKDIESNLRQKMAFGLPSDGIPVIEALNAGEPVVLMRPSARIAREIRTVAGELVTLLGIGDEAGGGSALRQASSRGTIFKRLTRRRAS
jgi:pilus assembly protein CpaE